MCGHILYKVRHTMERCGQIAAYSFHHGWALFWKFWTSPTQSTGNTWVGVDWSCHLNVQCHRAKHTVGWGQCNHMHSLRNTGHTTMLPMMFCAGEQRRHVRYVQRGTWICAYKNMSQSMLRSVYVLVWVQKHVWLSRNDKNWIGGLSSEFRCKRFYATSPPVYYMIESWRILGPAPSAV